MNTVTHEAANGKRKAYRPAGKKTVTLWLPKELHEHLREFAFKKRLSIQKICERGIVREAARNGFKGAV